ncbi:hypothetical protein B0H14DRAFT_3543951 [Mycena olivaceomarginata]|nr:hypothetical protein B0H14DRAFT_3543951 [Mycena olivaceomarginata]
MQPWHGRLRLPPSPSFSYYAGDVPKWMLMLSAGGVRGASSSERHGTGAGSFPSPSPSARSRSSTTIISPSPSSPSSPSSSSSSPSTHASSSSSSGASPLTHTKGGSGTRMGHVGLRAVAVSDGDGSRLTGTGPGQQAIRYPFVTDGYGTGRPVDGNTRPRPSTG